MTRPKLTHCQRGHAFDEKNTHHYTDKKGRVRRVCRKCAKNRNPFRQRLYGLSAAEYAELLDEQNGVCALCGRDSGERALSVDHDHKSRAIRGLLCSPCNTGLGVFHDDPQVLRRAIEYLEAHRRGQSAVLVEQEVLTPTDREEIAAAFEMVLDAFISDVEALAAGHAFTETLMWTHLPDAFVDGYDLRFALQFLIAAARVRDRLLAGIPFPASCVAEELALHAVMRTATINVRDMGDDDRAERLDVLTPRLLPDLDFLLLFEREFSLSRQRARSLGATHMSFDEWFRPFDVSSPIDRSALN